MLDCLSELMAAIVKDRKQAIAGTRSVNHRQTLAVKMCIIKLNCRSWRLSEEVVLNKGFLQLFVLIFQLIIKLPFLHSEVRWEQKITMSSRLCELKYKM